MSELTFWIFLMVVQGKGAIGMPSSTEIECREEYMEAKQSENVIMLSECQKFVLKPTKGEIGQK